MKERKCDNMKDICSEEYKDFLEFHNSILNKVQNSMKDRQPDYLSFMKQIEQQSFEVFEMISECQDNLLRKVQYDDNTKSAACAKVIARNNQFTANRYVVDYSLKKMPINRYEVYLTNAPLKTTELYKLRKTGSVLLIGDKSKQIDMWLKSLGLKPIYIPKDIDDVFMEQYFDSSFVGVLGIARKEWTEEEGFCYVKQMFFAAKHTANTWYKERVKPFFIAVSRLGGTFGMDGAEKDFVTASLSGLCKTAVKEWRNNVAVHYIDVEADLDDTQLISYISNELKYGDIPEVGYPNKDNRTIFALRERYEDKIDTQNLPDENDVFLVAGGGEGVTAVCIIELAKRFHSKFILFGMNKMDGNYVEKYEGMNREEIREVIIKEHRQRGEKIILADADKMARTIISQRQLRSTIKQLEAVGSQAVYYQCNIMDAEKLHEVAQEGMRKFGKITGIVHGAGVLSNSLLNKKTDKDFERVFGVKYYGINNMMKEVDSDNLKYLFFYSSIAGFFGNFGQSDYSCGNEYLNHYARYWNNTHPNCKVMSLNWGPWNGGMVDHALKSALLRRKKILIDLDVGKMFFVDAFAKVWYKSSCQLVINDVDYLGGAF